LVLSQDAAIQAPSSLVVWGTVLSGNYTTIYQRTPGTIGNDTIIVIATPNGAAAVDSLETTATPTVTWTPEGASVDNSITALNAASKLVYAVKTGTGGTIASQTATNLTGGVGAGIRAYIGDLLIQDASAHGASFVGTSNDSWISRWETGYVDLVIDDADLAVGEAVPTDRTALTAVVSQISARLEWTRPLFEAHYALNVQA
jgi:hypothetical protein